ncbi:MAG: choice-of-anchor Q domain-containing protein, partial [Anaerolineales bacterium]
MNTKKLRLNIITLGFIVLASGTAGCDVIGDILGGFAAVCEQTQLVVTKPEDTNDGICTADDCSLREAVITSNDCPGTQTIRVPNGLYTLTLTGAGEDMSRTGDLDIRDDVIISGEGVNFEDIPTFEEAVVIDGLNEDRIFDIQPARDLDRTSPLEVSLAGLWLQNGQEERGGGILNRGDLSMSGIHITNTRAVLNSSTGGVSQGGALLSQDNGNVEMEWVYIGPSSADEGGAVYIHSGLLEWSNGEASGNTATQDGGGLYIRYGAQARLDTVDFRDNEAGGDGGAIYTDGELDGSNVLMAANIVNGRGGGLFNGSLAEAWLYSMWITNNNADRGGGIFNAGIVYLYQSGINNNTAFANQGGGIANVRDALTPDGEPGAGLVLANVTVSGNMLGAPDSPGGAGLFNDDGHLFINFNTFAYNSPDGILDVSSSEREFLIRSSILAYHAEGNCHGFSGVSFGHNIDDGSTCGFSNTGDQTETDPLLRRLADFGSGGLVHALHPDSPAVDRGNDSECVATDQRGMSRPQGARCDVGAFELDPDSTEPPPEPGEEEETTEEEEG